MIYSNIYWGKNQDVNPDLVLQRVGTSEVLMLMKTLVAWPEILKSWSESERWSDGLMFLRLIWLALRKHMFSGWRPKIIQLIRHKMETISISPNGSTLRFGSRWGNSYSSKQLLGTDADIKGSRFQAVSSLCILFWCDVGLSWVSGLWDIFVHKTSRSVDDPQWRLQTTDHWPFRFVSEAVVFSTALRNIFFLFCERTQTTSYSYMRPNHPYLYLCIYIMFLMFVSHTLPCWFAYRLLGFVSVVLFGWRGLARIACPMDETIPGPKVDEDIGCLAWDRWSTLCESLCCWNWCNWVAKYGFVREPGTSKSHA
jgi:hypothetical protein